jgi:hypothetical protein
MRPPPDHSTPAMILSLLLSLVATQEPPALFVREEERLQYAAPLRNGENRVLLPMTTRSDRVPRAALHRDWVEFVLAAPTGQEMRITKLRVRATEHAMEEQLMVLDGELAMVGEPRLPIDVRTEGGEDRLPLVARLDGVGCALETLEILSARGAKDLIMILVEPIPPSDWRVPKWHRTIAGQATVIPVDEPRQTLTLLGEHTVDQLFHGSRRSLRDEELDPVEIRDASVIDIVSRSREPRLGRGRALPRIEPGKLLTRGHATALDEERPVTIPTGQALRVRVAAPEFEGARRSATLVVEVFVSDESPLREAAAHRDELPRAGIYRDVATEAGIHDVHFEGPELQLDIRPTMGPGAAWGDFDGDGLIDLYLVQGGGREGSHAPRNRLLHNCGDGSFEHVPGADDDGAGMGALFFDLEGDGDLDLYVANYGPDVLYRNDGLEGFVDASAEHELAGDGWSAGVCAADYDRDGDIDLYVTTYLTYDPALMPPVEELPGFAREDPVEMLPFAFPGGKNHFLENISGQLVERTEDLGLADELGRGMQPIFWDFDLDGDQDLYVANDVSYNKLWRNEGDGSFKDISFQTGMDDPRGGMGVATGDVDSDGDPDLFLTNWELEANALYRNNLLWRASRKIHTGTFQDMTVPSHLGRFGVGVTSWGCVLFDMDNDGDLDLFVPNGYTSPDYESTGTCVGQPNQLFLNDGEGRFEDASVAAGPDVTAPLASRAAAVCDFDRDGRLDLFVTNNNGPYQLLRNEFENAGHWLGVELRGRGGNTGAVGARVMLVAGDHEQAREVQAGSGYLAGHAIGAHFGLGEASEVKELHVRWPSGLKSSHQVPAVDRWMTISEPAPDDAEEKR